MERDLHFAVARHAPGGDEVVGFPIDVEVEPRNLVGGGDGPFHGCPGGAGHDGCASPIVEPNRARAFGGDKIGKDSPHAPNLLGCATEARRLEERLGSDTLLIEQLDQSLFAGVRRDANFVDRVTLDRSAQGFIRHRSQAAGGDKHKSAQEQNQLGTQR